MSILKTFHVPGHYPCQREILNEGTSFYLTGDLLDEHRMSDELFEEIWNIHPVEHGQVKIMGKVLNVPRWQQSYGCPYYFSGMMHEAIPVTHPYLLAIQKYVNKQAVDFGLLTPEHITAGVQFNQILINWYQDGQHYIGEHSDDESQLIPGTPIYTLSFGQTRDFVIRSKKGSTVYRRVVPVKSNTYLIMCGSMQTYYKHSVPKRALSKCPGRRISITLRCFAQK